MKETDYWVSKKKSLLKEISITLHMLHDHHIQKVEIRQRHFYRLKFVQIHLKHLPHSFHTGYQCQNMSYNYTLRIGDKRALYRVLIPENAWHASTLFVR